VTRGVTLIEIDGRPLHSRDVPMLSDGVDHTIRVVLG
jgi:hypothetical protein